MIKNFPIFDCLFLGGKNSCNNEIFINVHKTSCRVSELLFWMKKFEKIPHLRGFISLEKFFRKKLKNFPNFDRLFLGEKNCIITTLSVMYVKHAAPSVSIFFE